MKTVKQFTDEKLAALEKKYPLQTATSSIIALRLFYTNGFADGVEYASKSIVQNLEGKLKK
jgi:hypothetical protein